MIVSTSRYFFNYRHTANALTMYHLLRRFGIDDDHLILFLADSYACDPRNAYSGAIYNNANENEHQNHAQQAKFNLATHADKDSKMSYLLPYYAWRRQRFFSEENGANMNNQHDGDNSHISTTNNNTEKDTVDVREVNIGHYTLHADADNLYGCGIHVDYSGDDVTIRTFLEVLQGRHDGNTPLTRRLMSDSNSHILIYLAGHGARSVLKFQDS